MGLIAVYSVLRDATLGVDLSDVRKLRTGSYTQELVDELKSAGYLEGTTPRLTMLGVKSLEMLRKLGDISEAAYRKEHKIPLVQERGG